MGIGELFEFKKTGRFDPEGGKKMTKNTEQIPVMCPHCKIAFHIENHSSILLCKCGKRFNTVLHPWPATMHKLKIGREGLKEAAELEKGCDISTGPELTDVSQLAGVEFEPNKFIVINRKHINELNNLCEMYPEDGACKGLRWSIEHFISEYQETIKKPIDQKYYVCNQDEPYAPEVIRIILEGETEKKYPGFSDWRAQVYMLALEQELNLTNDTEEILLNHFKSGTTPAEFLDPNSIPW